MSRTLTRRVGVFQAAALPLLAFGFGLAVNSPILAAQKGGGNPLANRKAEIQKILRDQAIPSDQAQLFDQFFNDYLLEQFVKPTKPYSIDDLPKLRKDLRTSYFMPGKAGGEAHDRLNQLTYKKMFAIMRKSYGAYDAAIKYNALLVLGELNQQESPVKPWATPFGTLVSVVKSPTMKDYMKVAALIGIERHAAAGAGHAKTADISKMLLDLVNQQKAPASRDPAAHEWMRRLAGQALADIGSPGADNAVAAAFAAIMADPDASTSLRCEMAQNLGELKYPPGAKIDFTGLANSLGLMASQVCQQELERAKAANWSPTHERQELLWIVESAYSGLGSTPKDGLVAASANTSHKEFVESVRGKLTEIKRLLEDPDSEDIIDSDVVAKLKELQSSLTTAKKEQLMAAESKEKLAEPAKQ